MEFVWTYGSGDGWNKRESVLAIFDSKKGVSEMLEYTISLSDEKWELAEDTETVIIWKNEPNYYFGRKMKIIKSKIY